MVSDPDLASGTNHYPIKCLLWIDTVPASMTLSGKPEGDFEWILFDRNRSLIIHMTQLPQKVKGFSLGSVRHIHFWSFTVGLNDSRLWNPLKAPPPRPYEEPNLLLVQAGHGHEW